MLKSLIESVVGPEGRHRAALWKATARARRRLMQTGAIRLKAAFRKQLKAVAEEVGKAQTTAEAMDAMERAVDGAREIVEKPLLGIELATAPLFALESFRSVRKLNGKAQGPDAPDFVSRVRGHIQEQGVEKVRHVQETTKKRIRGAIDRAMAEPGKYPSGEERPPSIGEIAERILSDTRLAQINHNRALTIAHTETIRSSNYGSLMGAGDAAKLVGLELDKVWISTRDAATRRIEPPLGVAPKFDHVVMDGKAALLDGLFQVPMAPGVSEALEYPGDPRGSAGNVINCRCTIGYQPRGGF